MDRFYEFVQAIKEQYPEVIGSLVDDAIKSNKTPAKSIRYLKGLKEGFPEGYTATVDNSITNLGNQIIDDAINELRKEANNQEWRTNNE